MTGQIHSQCGKALHGVLSQSATNRQIYNNKKAISQMRDPNGQIYGNGQRDEKSLSGRSGKIS
jgi:hypothetical protein